MPPAVRPAGGGDLPRGLAPGLPRPAGGPPPQRLYWGETWLFVESEKPRPIAAWYLACLGLGGALACFQVFGESFRHTWPLLVHLSVRREAVIAGKLLAGIGMYSLLLLPGTGLLVLRLHWGGAYPGPFRAAAALPLLWPFLAGIAVYLAAFASALRPARWYATKWLPLLASLPTVVAALILHSESNPYLTRGQWWPRGGPSPDFLKPLALVVPICAISLALVLWMTRDLARRREF